VMPEIDYVVGSIVIYATIGFFSWLLWWENRENKDERD